MMPANSESESPDYAPIPSELRDIYGSIEDELIWIHGRWKMYRQLFGTNEARVQLLNEIAPTYFGELQGIWFHYVILEICRITDRPSSQVAKKGRVQNLVIRQLQNPLIQSQHTALADRLTHLHPAVVRSCKPLRECRNRRIAHSDLQSALGLAGSPIPGISRQTVEDALAAIRKYVNAFRIHFLGEEKCFGRLHQVADGDCLLHNLKLASAFRDLEAENPDLRLAVLNGRWRDA